MLASLVGLVAGAVACAPAKSDKPGESGKKPEQNQDITPRDTSAKCAPTFPLEYVAPDRIVAIGDLHGDLSAAQDTLRKAAIIGADNQWIGKSATLVQTGDVLDRGDDEKEILQWLQELAEQAKAQGGRVLRLNGNHELMNAVGDFRYVTPGGYSDYDHLSEASAEVDRQRAFAPGGVVSTLLSGSGVVAKVGKTLFVHGGILPKHVDYGLERFNQDAQCFLAGKSGMSAWFSEMDSPVWSRDYGSENPDCTALATMLSKAGAERLVIGHTVQPSGISAGCDEKVWRIDVGLSRFYGGPHQCLEILSSGQIRVVQ